GTREDLALLYGELGEIERGVALADQARQVAEEQLPILVYWAQAAQVLLHLQQGNLDGATELMATLTDYRDVKARFGYLPFMWVRGGLAQGEFARAMGEYGEAVALMDELYRDVASADIWYLRPDLLWLKGQALVNLGSDHTAEGEKMLAQARTTAETLGLRRVPTQH
ncbi:MAG: hypothetical protein KDE19_12995, partial [Caldilineaceae bacterium]|nr:hypothetical protein [Caldilineaceae bacterium]